MNTIYIYSDKISNRLVYTLDVIFKHVLFVNYSILSKEDFLKNKTGVKINYSSEQIENTIQIVPSTLLFETDITHKNPIVNWLNNTPYIFKTAESSALKHDLFSAVFYMVSRYEEYLPKDLDIHGRYKAENSLAYKNDFLEKPVVNLWIKEFQYMITNRFPEFHFPKREYNYINSLDIDVAYSYKGKSIPIIASSVLKGLVKLDFTELKNKYNYFFNKTIDPYDTYQFITALKTKYNSKNLYFFQVGNYGKFDKNLKHTSNDFIKLIKKLHLNNSIGIHPSYNSNKSKQILSQEINRLQNILDEDITKSRQHFLKLTFPTTYENSIEMGIKEDYTLGFASKIGFRAGICNSFPFFNVSKNESTELILHPFQVMDGTLNTYMNLSPEKANKKVNDIIAAIKSVNGTFVSLWHNSSLTERNEWKNWKKVYISLVKNATNY